MRARTVNPKLYCPIVLLAILGLYSCTSSPELVSETTLDDKVSKLRIGQSDKPAVESVLGSDHGSDRNYWIYQFADKQFEIFERQGTAAAAFPISAGVVPTNTRAVVTVSFSQAGIVKRIEVARFFDEPFVNDYWFLMRETVKDPLASLANLAESVGFKIAGVNKDDGVFSFEDPGSKARGAVKLDGPILRITSRNPHHRLASEYRVYTRRESALTNALGNSELVQ
jgi:hypothetical protein